MVASPNYRKAESLAYKILSTFPHPTIPINVFSIASYFTNLRIKSYSWFAKLTKMTINEVVDFAKSESGCCYYNVGQDNYLILYNDTIPNTGHIRWTLGHEFGHFLLKHNELADEAVVSRNSLTQSQYTIYEKEANCFARCLLAPPNLLAALDISYFPELADTFDLSPSASQNILSFVSGSRTMGISYKKDCELTQNFKVVIERFLNLKHCIICGHEYSKSYAYCPICGSQGHDNAGGDYMVWPGVMLNENMRVKVCPICENEEHLSDAEFCMICGKPIINQCSFAAMDPAYIDNYTQQCSHREALPGNARYCPYCGEKTTFLLNGSLTSWNGEPDNDSELPY